MADIRAAILGGATEARRAHDRLGTRETWERAGGRIDVFGAIDAYDIPLMFQPLDNLLAARGETRNSLDGDGRSR